jgi:hypothetical protein
MAVQFTIFETRNQMNPESDANRYVYIKSTEDVTLESSEWEISERCSVTRTDILAV